MVILLNQLLKGFLNPLPKQLSAPLLGAEFTTARDVARKDFHYGEVKKDYSYTGVHGLENY